MLQTDRQEPLDSLAYGRSVGRQLGAAQERAACAELVRAAGCLCEGLIRAKLSVRLKEGCHDPRCPQALAAAIEARGR